MPSSELLLMRSPAGGYRELCAHHHPIALLARIIGFSLALGLAASCSIARAPLLSHWLLCSLAWSFVPTLQLCSGFAVSLALHRRAATRRELAMHFAGNGPHLFAALFAAAWSVAPIDGAGVRYGPILAVSLGAIAYGAIIHAAYFRVVHERSRWGAALWVLGEWVLRVALILVWFALMNNLAPQILGRRS